MSNIIGEGFDPKITKQVDVRQSIYGSLNRNNETLTYLNNRNGWCKLVSSVDIKNPQLRKTTFTESDMASQFVLFNGVTNESPTKGTEETYQRSGIWDGVSSNNGFAYGIGGGGVFGLNPMPGITSVVVKTETRGSLKTATININANNKYQFDIIDTLYLRLGFSMLLEWGNNCYYTNDKQFISDNQLSLADDFLTNKLTYDNYYNKIKEKVSKSCGNYDAIVGKVINFNWTIEKDGSYNIIIILRSMGDIIESLKMNILLPQNSTTTPNPQPTPTPQPKNVIKDFANIHEIGKHFYDLKIQLSNLPSFKNGMSTLTSTDKEFTGGDGETSVIAFSQIYVNRGEEYYIKLGYFLKWLEKNLIPNVGLLKDNIKLLKINNKVKENIIYVLERQISTDPRKCIFKSEFQTPNSGDVIIAGDADNFKAFNKKANKYGYIMNVYFNMDYILEQINILKENDEKGIVSLYNLLKSLCYGWNSSVGYFNNLNIIIDDDEIKFIDENPLPDRNEILKSINKPTQNTIFNVFGYDNILDEVNTNAGFIKSVNFTVSVPPKLANMLTIGATSEGYIVGQDSTAISRMNNGLVDRFKEIITQTNNTTSINNSLEKNYKPSVDAFQIFLTEMSSTNTNPIPTWNDETIQSFSNLVSTFYEYEQANFTKNNTKTETNSASPNNGFLPFNLQLEMDGLSGMKVYQKYTINSEWLPSNYPESLEFITVGITNIIQNNKWTTTLDSIAIAFNTTGQSNQITNNQNKTENNKSIGNPNTILSNQDLRTIIINAGYPESSGYFKLAYAIGVKEGWDKNSNGGKGSRSYRNNNPGNLDYSNILKTIDPNASLENNPYGTNRFAQFTTAELGVKALVELKIKKWGGGNMPITLGNSILIEENNGGQKYIKGNKPTLAQFVYTYAPPNQNPTETYIDSLIRDIKPYKSDINRDTLIIDIIK